MVLLYRSLGQNDVKVPVLGQGTWMYGEDSGERVAEIRALGFGIENGMTLIDTAEGYANGGSERIVGEAIKDCRNDIFLTTKVSAHNCSYKGVIEAAEKSIERLNTTYIDLYLQHWPSKKYEVEETIEAMVYLKKEGIIKHIGVSNYTPALLERAQAAAGKEGIACNQVGYHLNDRRIEKDVLPYCQKEGITVMAYSPFGYAPEFFGNQGFPKPGTRERAELEKVANKYGKSVYQVALNWVLRQEGLITIPKAKNIEHIKSNLASIGWDLSKEELDHMDSIFPKPVEGLPLQMY